MAAWTLNDLMEKAQREGVSLSELGRRGGRKAARLRKKKQKQTQAQLTLGI